MAEEKSSGIDTETGGKPEDKGQEEIHAKGMEQKVIPEKDKKKDLKGTRPDVSERMKRIWKEKKETKQVEIKGEAAPEKPKEEPKKEKKKDNTGAYILVGISVIMVVGLGIYLLGKYLEAKEEQEYEGAMNGE